MPFLTVNGVTVPTAKGGVVDVLEIGDKRRSFDGTLIRDVRAFKRKWAFQTKPITELRAIALINMLQGEGFYMPFDGDLYAENGYGYSGYVAQIASTAADGAFIYDEYGQNFAKFGIGAISADGSQTNMLSAAQSLPSSTAGFGASGGGSFALNAGNKFTGANSLAITSAAASNTGAATFPAIAGALNTSYTASVFVKSASPVTITLYDSANGVSASTTVTPVSSTTWKRAVVTITTPASGSTPTLFLYALSGVAGVFTFYVGGLQLEATTVANSWLTGAGTRTATSIIYPLNPCGPEGATFNWWQTTPIVSTQARYAFSARDDVTAANQITGYIPSSTEFYARIKTPANDYTASVSGLTYSSGWNMLTMVLRAKPASGESVFTFYKNGVLAGVDTPTSLPLAELTQLSLGSNFGSNILRARMDDVQILPYPVDATAVAGWYAASAGIGSTPYVLVGGDALQDTSASATGEVTRVETVGFRDANGWQNNGRVVSFVLEEA